MTLRTSLITATTALALALASPASAKPDKDNIFAFIAGMAALAILSGAANGQPAPRPYQPQPQPYHPQPYHPQPAPPPVVYHGLPQNCAISVQTKYGWQKVYTQQCLWRAGYGRDLPRACATRVRGQSGWNEVFTDYCLRRNGF